LLLFQPWTDLKSLTECFGKLALDTAQYKMNMWLRHDDSKFLALLHGSERLQKFFSHTNSCRLPTKFIKQAQSNNTLRFHDTLVPKKGLTLSTNVWVKSTNMGCYIHFESNHPLHVKGGIIHSLFRKLLTLAMNAMISSIWDIITLTL
jgi:hypothetical protein